MCIHCHGSPMTLFHLHINNMSMYDTVSPPHQQHVYVRHCFTSTSTTCLRTTLFHLHINNMSMYDTVSPPHQLFHLHINNMSMYDTVSPPHQQHVYVRHCFTSTSTTRLCMTLFHLHINNVHVRHCFTSTSTTFMYDTVSPPVTYINTVQRICL